MNVAALSPQELVSRVRSLNSEGNRVLAKLLVHMGEMDARRLYEKHACSSMFAFCRRLGMSEGSASRRIDCARAVRKYPCLLPRIENGELHLTALSIVSSILTPDNVDSVVAAVAGKTRLEVEAFKVRYMPKPRVKDSIRKLPTPNPTVQPEAPPPVAVTPRLELVLEAPSPPPVAVMDRADLVVEPPPPEPMVAPPGRVAPPMRPVVPLQEDAFKVQFTADQVLVDKIEHAKAMMRHRNAKGDLAMIVDAALDLLIAKLEKERFGKTDRPQKKERLCKPGHVSQATRRELFERDGAQCTYVDEAGNRCSERGWLEIDHDRAKGRKGGEELENLRIRCRAHNQMHARDVFGAVYIERRIEESRRERAAKRTTHGADAVLPPITATGGGDVSGGGAG